MQNLSSAVRLAPTRSLTWCNTAVNLKTKEVQPQQSDVYSIRVSKRSVIGARLQVSSGVCLKKARRALLSTKIKITGRSGALNDVKEI
jgi:hypothetical protein